MPSALDDVYASLAELKEIDERAFRVERDVVRMPDEIKLNDEAITLKRQAFDTAKLMFAEAEKKLRAAERELKDKEDALFKAEGKMMEVKTNEEYQAATRENENQKKLKGVMEERVLQLITSLEEQKKTLAATEAEFRTHEKGLLEQRDKLIAEQAELQKALDALLSQRLTVSAQLDPSTATVYRKIVAAHKGIAIVCAEQGRCLSCNVLVRPQLYNEILGRKAVHRCPSCGKILLTPKRVAEPALGN